MAIASHLSRSRKIVVVLGATVSLTCSPRYWTLVRARRFVFFAAPNVAGSSRLRKVLTCTEGLKECRAATRTTTSRAANDRLDQYGRTVAACSVNRADLAEWIVRNGLAIDRLKYRKEERGSPKPTGRPHPYREDQRFLPVSAQRHASGVQGGLDRAIAYGCTRAGRTREVHRGGAVLVA
jgi:Staphylococcal nuclease homologue